MWQSKQLCKLRLYVSKENSYNNALRRVRSKERLNLRNGCKRLKSSLPEPLQFIN